MSRFTIQNIVSKQLRNPSGLAGNIVAGLMAAGNKQMYDYILSETENLGPITMEIGFGGGNHFNKIANHNNGGSIVGIEKSGSMVKRARRKNKELIKNNKLKLIKGDSSNLPFESSLFDSVISLNTLYFWKNPNIDIAEIQRIIKPGGKLILGINSKEIMIKNGYNKRYFNFYEKEELEAILREAKFSSITHQYRKLRIEDCHLFEAIK